MVFSDTSATKGGLIQECESILFDDDYGRISDDAALLATFTRRMNRALDKVTIQIQKNDGRWQWDDNNQTTYPISTTDLAIGQQDYPLTITHLRIIRVEVKDSAGNFMRLLPVDTSDIKVGTTQFLNQNGMPIFYDKFANSLFLYPAPSYVSVAGLKVFYQRGPSYFATSDTTKEPGFNSMFHELIAMMACYDYASPKKMEIAATLKADIGELMQELGDYYSFRQGDEQTTMSTMTRRRRYK